MKPDFLVRLSNPKFKAIVECQHLIHIATHAFWDNQGVKCLNLPITTGSISSPMGLGSDSLPVRVKMFGVNTFLADSMQFGLELGCRMSEQGCYYLMPSFRGEAPDQTHLCQFFHSEVELPVGHTAVMKTAEDYLKYLCQVLLERAGDKIKALAGRLDHLERLIAQQEFPVISLRESRKLLGDDPKYFDFKSNNLALIKRSGEVELLNKFDGPIWLSEFEHLQVPFYQAFHPSNRELALASDLLLGIGEILGCGERHYSSQELNNALSLHGVSESEYQWYIDMKHFQPMKTSGFGMGVERFLMWVLGIEDIREIEIMPRINGLNISP